MKSQLQIPTFGSMVRIGPSTFLDQPSTCTSHSPTVIIFGWLDASPKHVGFYLAKHRELFPDARLFLVQGSAWNMTYATFSVQLSAMEGLLTAIRAEIKSPIFLHLFSNAGAQSASTFLRNQHASANQHSALPIKGLLLDSAPSDGSYAAFYQALSFQIEQVPVVLRIFAILFAHGLISSLLLFSLLTGRPHALEKSFQDLNDPQLISRDVPRTYFFSQEDRLVRSTDVETHAAQAVQRGWTVKMEEFKGTAHCRHAKEGGEARYWSGVREVMEGHGLVTSSEIAPSRV